ncbi:hypothetical protein BGX28_001469 [Mortierella sp. GBA30]|nr:hypothetical protein BGX28_001469 [Mortierella sp. GBA30]
MKNEQNSSSFSPSILSAPDKRISIHVHGTEFITHNKESIPLFYSTLETPAAIQATVTFENDKNCVVRSAYTPLVVSEQTFKMRRWTMDLNSSPDEHILSGKYVKQLTAPIDPVWPSSAAPPAHFKGIGWISYIFEAKFSTTRLGVPVVAAKQLQEIWVLTSTSIPPASSLAFAESRLMTVDGMQQPLIVRESWMKSILPVILTLPADALHMGQILPVTVRMGPFGKKSKHAGQTVVVIAAYFSLCENIVGRANGMTETFETSCNVLNLPIKDGWPKNNLRWERTVNLTLPEAPEVTATAKTKYMDISYALVLTMKIKAEGEKDYKAKEYVTEAGIHLLVPEPTCGNAQDLLPAYAPLEFGPAQENMDSPVFIDVKA